jgi:hypothetical protein
MPRTEYWSFIEAHYPNYYTCNNILLSDILTRKLDNEQISQKDEEMIKGWDVKQELLELDSKLMAIAMENYFKTLLNTKTLQIHF